MMTFKFLTILIFYLIFSVGAWLYLREKVGSKRAFIYSLLMFVLLSLAFYFASGWFGSGEDLDIKLIRPVFLRGN